MKKEINEYRNSISLKLTRILIAVAFAVMAAMLFLTPRAARLYVELSDGEDIFAPLCAAMYAATVCGIAALIKLWGLIGNVGGGEVFVDENTRILRAISYWCFAAGAVFFAFGFVRFLSFIIAFSAVFMGIILRVLRNVFAAAVELRKENDQVI